MAHQIYNAIPEDEQYYTVRSGDNKGQSVKRNRVVIYFTDGQPGDNSEADQYDEANDVVEKAHVLKKDDKALIFSIGVFGVSDTEPLTYQYAAPSNPNEEYEYEPGYVYTVTSENNYFFFDTTSYHYLFRYWRTGDPNNFGTEANDTIFDYMSTVSSNYPDAEKFVSDNWVSSGGSSLRKDDNSGNYSNWLDMTGDVRGDLIDNYGYGENLKNYYRLASNQESLIDAFRSAVDITEVQENQGAGEISGDTVLKDIIDTDNFVKTENTEVIIQVIPSTRAQGSDIVTPIAEPRTPDAEDSITYAWGEKTEQYDRSNELIVRGFNYNAHHIAWDNDASQQLRVIIKGLVPKENATGVALTSNKSDSGIYANDTIDADMLKAFPVPEIDRHKYTVKIDPSNTNATVASTFTFLDETGNAITIPSDAILQWNNERGFLSSVLTNGTLDMGAIGNTTFYLENLPAGTQLRTNMSIANDPGNSYDYSLVATELPNTPIADANLSGTNYLVNYKDTSFVVSSIANNRDVTFHLKADDSPFVDSSYKFKVNVTLTGTDIAQKLSSVNSDNNGVIQFTADGTDTLEGVLELTRGTVDPINLSAVVKVPDGAVLTVGHTDPFYTTDYISEEVDGDSAYTAHAITAATDIYIKDTVSSDVGAGVTEESNSARVLLYTLVVAAALSGGAGAVYVYRRKNDFGESE